MMMMLDYELWWSTINNHKQPQTTTNIHQQPQSTTNNRKQPQTATNKHKQPQTTTNNHKQPQATTSSHACPWSDWQPRKPSKAKSSAQSRSSRILGYLLLGPPAGLLRPCIPQNSSPSYHRKLIREHLQAHDFARACLPECPPAHPDLPHARTYVHARTHARTYVRTHERTYARTDAHPYARPPEHVNHARAPTRAFYVTSLFHRFWKELSNNGEYKINDDNIAEGSNCNKAKYGLKWVEIGIIVIMI